eukprot:CCRYP_017317-RA/>CCRYP_017317-RA protein AED:0.46 eAED:0.46 QI:193/1/1/1/1/1/2/102/84
MKLSIAFVATILTGAAAFTPSAVTRTQRFVESREQTTILYSDPKEGEEGGLDLNLEEMFDMFDAADKGQDFEKVIKDVKKEQKD